MALLVSWLPHPMHSLAFPMYLHSWEGTGSSYSPEPYTTAKAMSHLSSPTQPQLFEKNNVKTIQVLSIAANKIKCS